MGKLYELEYNREKVYEYAEKWSLTRNKNYYDFSKLGGDCTNFISQCLYAGSSVMNYSPNLGWYYENVARRTPSWTGVQYFCNFIVNNKGAGPYGHKCKPNELKVGDFVQLSFNGEDFKHSLVIVKIDGEPIKENIYIATHTNDAFLRKLSSYAVKDIRYLHIDGVRKYN